VVLNPEFQPNTDGSSLLLVIYCIARTDRDTAYVVCRRLVIVGCPNFLRGQSMWDLWWIKFHGDRFFFESFCFLLPVCTFTPVMLHVRLSCRLERTYSPTRGRSYTPPRDWKIVTCSASFG
jgi:hypothetical protein